MANSVLLPIYKKIFEKEFDYGSFDNRLLMQKTIYLLQEYGVGVGDYGFSWYKHGPYSQTLLDDMYYVSGTQSIPLRYTTEAEKRIEFIKDIINSKEAIQYGVKNWLECLASLHYLKKNVLASSAKREEVISELVKRKPHLNNQNLNSKAYDIIQKLSIR